MPGRIATCSGWRASMNFTTVGPKLPHTARPTACPVRAASAGRPPVRRCAADPTGAGRPARCAAPPAPAHSGPPSARCSTRPSRPKLTRYGCARLAGSPAAAARSFSVIGSGWPASASSRRPPHFHRLHGALAAVILIVDRHGVRHQDSLPIANAFDNRKSSFDTANPFAPGESPHFRPHRRPDRSAPPHEQQSLCLPRPTSRKRRSPSNSFPSMPGPTPPRATPNTGIVIGDDCVLVASLDAGRPAAIGSWPLVRRVGR